MRAQTRKSDRDTKNDGREPPHEGRVRISQETIAIVTVGVALAGLNLVTTGDLRDLRNEWQAESRQLRNEARSDREELSNEAPRRPRSLPARERSLPARDPPTHAGTGRARRNRRVNPTENA